MPTELTLASGVLLLLVLVFAGWWYRGNSGR